MSSRTYRNPGSPIRPSIYGEEDEIVKKSTENHSKRSTRNISQRSVSVGSNTVALNQARNENPVNVNGLASLPDLASKPLLHEVVIERGRGNENERDRSRLENPQREQPHIFAWGRRYVDDDYLNPHYDRYTRRRTQRYYSPPRRRSPTRNEPIRDKTPSRDGPRTIWSNVRHILREPLAEFFGIFILVLFGDG